MRGRSRELLKNAGGLRCGAVRIGDHRIVDRIACLVGEAIVIPTGAIEASVARGNYTDSGGWEDNRKLAWRRCGGAARCVRRGEQCPDLPIVNGATAGRPVYVRLTSRNAAAAHAVLVQ